MSCRTVKQEHKRARHLFSEKEFVDDCTKKSGKFLYTKMQLFWRTPVHLCFLSPLESIKIHHSDDWVVPQQCTSGRVSLECAPGDKISRKTSCLSCHSRPSRQNPASSRVCALPLLQATGHLPNLSGMWDLPWTFGWNQGTLPMSSPFLTWIARIFSLDYLSTERHLVLRGLGTSQNHLAPGCLSPFQVLWLSNSDCSWHW